ncbi:bacteriocin biosynthesis cyclodehydratase domain-containing protein [Streptacidiphilus sp. MAP12-16]|uniref:TOMM precursor leader peptide-binding protein n=1 Tax=Streptacidiphilus sp. MAP12-16 TaxID=3156300 RepID=UPI003515C19D
MAVAYEEIAETRPRLRRDILFTETPSGVLFHNAQGGFGLNTKSAYRFASLIVPHLNGANSVSALGQGLGEAQRNMVAQLVGALYDHGFARDAAASGTMPADELAPEVAARFASQIAYVDHYADNDSSRFQRFRQSRVAVLGDDMLARWCALSLVHNGCAAIGVMQGVDSAGNDFEEVRSEAAALTEAGCPVSLSLLESPGGSGSALLGWDELDGYDLVVVAGGSTGERQLARLVQAGIPAGRTVLPAWTFGDRAVIGPLMEPGRTGCWVCAVLRLSANGDAAAAADLWSSIAPGAPREPARPHLSKPLAAMLGNLLGFEVFRFATGALPAETAGQVIIQDLDSLDVVSERLLAHPRCPYCSLADTADTADAADTANTADTAVNLAAADDTAQDGTYGPPGVENVADDQVTQAALAELEARNVLVGTGVGVFGGFADESWEQSPLKVTTLTVGVGHPAPRQISAFDLHHVAAARLRGLLRAAEVYAEHVVPVSGVLRGPELEAARANWPLVSPEQLSTASGTGGPVDRIPAWAGAVSLLSGETVLVPAAALRTFGTDNQERLFEATSAGTGAGGSARAAAARGLLTALSYDALRQALRGAVPVARVAPESLTRDAELTFLARSAANLGAELELLEFGTAADRAVPVLLARVADPETGAWHWAAGSALRWQQGAVEAIRDLLGRLQLGREPGAAAGVDTGDPLFRELDAGSIVPSGETKADLHSVQTWDAAVDRLRRAGQDVLLAPVTAADLRVGRIHVARVLLGTGAVHAR